MRADGNLPRGMHAARPRAPLPPPAGRRCRRRLQCTHAPHSPAGALGRGPNDGCCAALHLFTRAGSIVPEPLRGGCPHRLPPLLNPGLHTGCPAALGLRRSTTWHSAAGAEQSALQPPLLGQKGGAGSGCAYCNSSTALSLPHAASRPFPAGAASPVVVQAHLAPGARRQRGVAGGQEALDGVGAAPPPQQRLHRRLRVHACTPVVQSAEQRQASTLRLARSGGAPQQGAGAKGAPAHPAGPPRHPARPVPGRPPPPAPCAAATSAMWAGVKAAAAPPPVAMAAAVVAVSGGSARCSVPAPHLPCAAAGASRRARQQKSARAAAAAGVQLIALDAMAPCLQRASKAQQCARQSLQRAPAPSQQACSSVHGPPLPCTRSAAAAR